jgi:hypothetical protein
MQAFDGNGFNPRGATSAGDLRSNGFQQAEDGKIRRIGREETPNASSVENGGAAVSGRHKFMAFRQQNFISGLNLFDQFGQLGAGYLRTQCHIRKIHRFDTGIEDISRRLPPAGLASV